jgi:MFS family permease
VPRVFGLGRDTSILFWAWFIWGLGAGLWSYFWPVYLARLGADSVQVGVAIGSASLAATLVYLPGGFVAQLGHHKWQLVTQHALVTLATSTFGLAQAWWHVLPGVVLSNVVALLSPATNSYIAEAADHDEVPVPTVYTAIGAAQFTTMTLSPPLGGWIADRYGMAALFPVVCLAYAASVGAMCLLRSRPMKRAGSGGIGDPAAARRSAWAAGVDAYRDVLMSRQVRLLLLNAVLVYAGIHLALSFAPLYLREVYAYDAAAIGWSGSAASAGAALLLYAVERLRRRRGATAAMWVSCGLIALHLAATIASPALWVQLAGFLCRGGVQTASTLTTVALSEAVSRPSLGPAVAVFATAAGISAILAPPLGGSLYALFPAAPFFAGITLLLLAVPLTPRAFGPARRAAAA